MNFTESIDIAAAPERVWPYLANPILMATWNIKLIHRFSTTEGFTSLQTKTQASGRS